jgi:hypothetical protein
MAMAPASIGAVMTQEITAGVLWRSRATRVSDRVRMVDVKLVANIPAMQLNSSRRGYFG